MHTGAIRYRVADFLKRYPPFEWMEEPELLQLVGGGKVKFHESDEYVFSAGEPHGQYVFVIQQGAVELTGWSGDRPQLLDIRGPGDLIGLERFCGQSVCSCSARTTSDVLLYAVPAAELEALLARHPRALQFVKAHALGLAAGELPSENRSAARPVLDTARLELLTCLPDDTLPVIARRMHAAGSGVISVVDASRRLLGVITPARILDAVARLQQEPNPTAATLMATQVPCRPTEAAAADCLLAHAGGQGEVLAITADGSRDGPLVAVITAQEIDAAFSDQPAGLVRAIGHALNRRELRILNQRARRFAAHQLTSPQAVEWLPGFLARIDSAIVSRLLALSGPLPAECCWFGIGATARGELLAPVAPRVGLAWETGDEFELTRRFHDLSAALLDCGYSLPRGNPHHDPVWPCAPLAAWKERYSAWVRDPVGARAYLYRSFLDLAPLKGCSDVVANLKAHLLEEVSRERGFLWVLANDSLSQLPPLTFYHDLVVDESGNQNEVLRLKKNALNPLVDAARVLGLEAGSPALTGTIARLRHAAGRYPEQRQIMTGAIAAFQVALLHQGRCGIREHSDGSELNPATLSRYDQQLLKGGFRAIFRLLEFTESRLAQELS